MMNDIPRYVYARYNKNLYGVWDTKANEVVALVFTYRDVVVLVKMFNDLHPIEQVTSTSNPVG